MDSIIQILNKLDTIAPLSAMLFFLLKRKQMTRELFLVFLFCLVQFLCNLTATILDILRMTNYWVYKINTIFTFIIIFQLFTKYLFHIKARSRIFYILVYLTISSLLLWYNGDGITQFNSISAALSSLIIVGLCLYFFYIKLIYSAEEVSVPETSVFWCVVGLFTYYAGSFFIFISYTYLTNSSASSVVVLWRFQNILLLICCGYISYGILCKSYQTISSSS
ncbi:MAG: hypothetical protein QM727_08685 [Niabella sp.]